MLVHVYPKLNACACISQAQCLCMYIPDSMRVHVYPRLNACACISQAQCLCMYIPSSMLVHVYPRLNACACISQAQCLCISALLQPHALHLICTYSSFTVPHTLISPCIVIPRHLPASQNVLCLPADSPPACLHTHRLSACILLEGTTLRLGGTPLAVRGISISLMSEGVGAVLDAEGLSRVAYVSDGATLRLYKVSP